MQVDTLAANIQLMFTQLNVTIYQHSNGPSTGVEM